ncbi:MAG: hypothetical protein K8R77_02515 [Anaerolineaceae bacterium]|nr:hypothetical protein [Anaerolineaceae bacterium]
MDKYHARSRAGALHIVYSVSSTRPATGFTAIFNPLPQNRALSEVRRSPCRVGDCSPALPGECCLAGNDRSGLLSGGGGGVFSAALNTLANLTSSYTPS